MTSVTLTKLWINRVDTGEAISANSDRGKEQAFSTEHGPRRYASGRMRNIGTKGESGSLPYTLIRVSLTTKELLREWARDAILVQVRDNRGQKWFGTFAGVDVLEEFEASWYDVRVVLRTVTHVEGV